MTKSKNPRKTGDGNSKDQHAQMAPVYEVGLVKECSPVDDWSPPPEIKKPEDWPLSRCYRLNADKDRFGKTGRMNIHLLAAFGTFDEPFVPVTIAPEHEKCPWAQLPTIDSVELNIGRKVHESGSVWYGGLTCVVAITITVSTSDGKTFSSPVCVAVKPDSDESVKASTDPDDDSACYDAYVTRDAATQVDSSDILYLLGGVPDSFDDEMCCEYQIADFEKCYRLFWLKTAGPDEPLRQDLMDRLATVKGRWRSVTIKADGSVAIKFESGKTKKLLSPAA